MITLADGTMTLTLPSDLVWSDEASWHPVEQSVTNTLTGAILVENATRLAGRPITLESGTDFAWLKKSVLDQLMAWAAVAGQALTLSLRGVSRLVVFRHQDKALEATLIRAIADPGADEYYKAMIRLMEI